ncbi:hypothetical protein [uncultured Nostoc sp.]|uniref:hypothetical protein n=1 Tax=uncultured Nostoc sp. TaxID=340711 RepID=UPI0035CA1BA3
MTELGIKIGFVYETGEILAQAIGDINPLIMSKMVAKDIHIFRDLCFYPKDLTQPLDIKSDEIRVRSLTFSLDDNLDRAGQTFLKNLFLLIPLELTPIISKGDR